MELVLSCHDVEYHWGEPPFLKSFFERGLFYPLTKNESSIFAMFNGFFQPPRRRAHLRSHSRWLSATHGLTYKSKN
jgi:hypothetical protein